MTAATGSLAVLLEGFFTRRLMQQRQASAHTIASYRDAFRLFLRFAQKRLKITPSALALEQLDAPLIAAFLADLENERGVSTRSRNLRHSAIRSFFQYAAFESPGHASLIQRVLAIPSKRCTRKQVCHLTRDEVEALLEAPDRSTWSGRRDHVLLLLALQTGLRLSEITGLRIADVRLGSGAHVHVLGKGRKERCTPLAKQTQAALHSWMSSDLGPDAVVLFPSARGGRLSADGVQYLVAKHVATATKVCPSMARKRVTPHVLRHTAAMELLQAGVDRSVIAMWLGHESLETTQIYLDADLTFKERVLDKVVPPDVRARRYRPDDQLMAFLSGL
jgi:integrase/recombinase XerD